VRCTVASTMALWPFLSSCSLTPMIGVIRKFENRATASRCCTASDSLRKSNYARNVKRLVIHGVPNKHLRSESDIARARATSRDPEQGSWILHANNRGRRTSFRIFASSSRNRSRWSGIPSITRVRHVPQMPWRQKVGMTTLIRKNRDNRVRGADIILATGRGHSDFKW
jgi:hypothetical protein